MERKCCVEGKKLDKVIMYGAPCVEKLSAEQKERVEALRGKGRGVCGTAWQQARTIIVPDVEQFPGHIACSSLSRSEIVVPLIRDGQVTAVLDIDSTEPATFDDTDARWLEMAVELI